MSSGLCFSHFLHNGTHFYKFHPNLSHYIIHFFIFVDGMGKQEMFYVGCDKNLFLGLNKKLVGLILHNTLKNKIQTINFFFPYIILHMKVFCIILTYFTWMNMRVLLLLVELAKVTKVGTNVLLLTRGPWN